MRTAGVHFGCVLADAGYGMRYRDVEQDLICSLTAASVSSCSLRSRTLRAAFGGALRASLTFAARDELCERRSDDGTVALIEPQDGWLVQPVARLGVNGLRFLATL